MLSATVFYSVYCSSATEKLSGGTNEKVFEVINPIAAYSHLRRINRPGSRGNQPGQSITLDVGIS